MSIWKTLKQPLDKEFFMMRYGNFCRIQRPGLPTLALFLLLVTVSFGQGNQNFWQDLTAIEMREYREGPETERIRSYRGLRLQESSFRQALDPKSVDAAILDFPLPDKGFLGFAIRETRNMAPGLAARYPEIRTFDGRAIDGSGRTLRFDLSPRGLYAEISGPGERVIILPMEGPETSLYAAYSLSELDLEAGGTSFFCGAEEAQAANSAGHGTPLDLRQDGSTDLRVYRLAMACTVEYTNFWGGTRPQALAAIVSQVNRLNEILERDLAIRFELVEENDSLIFVDEDAYSNGQPALMMEENPPIINAKIGVTAYDIGHVLGTNNNLAGIAFLGGICNSTYKARGASTTREPRGDPFVVSVLAHEIGHQLGATHTFNSCQNASLSTGYEPGGGTTIMSYAGICGNPVNNLQETADPYYHTASIEQILLNTRGGSGNSCARTVPTGNRDPELLIEQEDGFYIPVQTPFRLRAQSEDADGDALTYTWEQFDLGPVNSPPGEPEGNSPLFRSLPPDPSPERIFPALESILEGRNDRSEVLPSYSRDLTFRCTVRDNFPGGGAVAWDQVAFKSDSTAGPFRVVGLDLSEGNAAGKRMEVRWDVAGTDNPRVDCHYVNILLSTDGGYTFSDTLAREAPNRGSARVTLPDIPTEQARIMVAAANNVFFAISDSPFTIREPEEPTYTLEVSPRGQGDHCLPGPLRFEIRSGALLGFDEPLQLDLVGDLPEGAGYSFSKDIIDPSQEESSVLTLQLAASVQDTFRLAVQATTPDQQTSLREIQFSTLSNDFSDLRLLTPAPEARDLTFPGPFTWSRASDADAYHFELASAPGFGPGEVIADAILVDTFFRTDLRLPDDAIFFWRVSPINRCGLGAPTPAQAFQSGLNVCITYEASDLPINIPGTSQEEKPTIRSVIRIEDDVRIEDLNIPLIQANYQPVRSLKMTLSGPSGTTITLLEPSCGSTLNFLAGFDDQAPDSLQCPPDDGLLAIPVDSLGRFRGEALRGDWTLSVIVDQPGFGSAGTLRSWSLESCAPIVPEDPILSRLDTLQVPPGMANTVLPDQLTATRENVGPDELVFTLLSVPSRGELLLQGQPLGAGDTFTQEDINAFRLMYAHSGQVEEQDSFLFMVRDSRGGWLNQQVFPINMYEGAIVDTDDPPAPAFQFTVSPNPARERVFLQLENGTFGDALEISLFSMQGQRLRGWRIRQPGDQVELSLGGLPAGSYILHVRGEIGSISRIVAVQ